MGGGAQSEEAARLRGCGEARPKAQALRPRLPPGSTDRELIADYSRLTTLLLPKVHWEELTATEQLRIKGMVASGAVGGVF